MPSIREITTDRMISTVIDQNTIIQMYQIIAGGTGIFQRIFYLKYTLSSDRFVQMETGIRQ